VRQVQPNQHSLLKNLKNHLQSSRYLCVI